MRLIIFGFYCFLISSPLFATGDKKNPSDSQTITKTNWADFDDDDDAPITLPWGKSAQLTASEPLPSSSSSTLSTSSTSTTPPSSPPKIYHPLNLDDFLDPIEEAKANFTQEIHDLFPLPTYQENEDIYRILTKYCNEIRFTKANRHLQDALKARCESLWSEKEKTIAPTQANARPTKIDFSRKTFVNALNTYNTTQGTSDPFILCRKHTNSNLVTPYYGCLIYLASVDYLTDGLKELHNNAEAFLEKALTLAEKTHVPEVIARALFGFEKYYGACLQDAKRADQYKEKIALCLRPPAPQKSTSVTSPSPDATQHKENQHNKSTVEKIPPTFNYPESLASLVSFIDYKLSTGVISGLISWPYEEEKWELIGRNLRGGHKHVELINVLKIRVTSLRNASQTQLLQDLYRHWPYYFHWELLDLEKNYLSTVYDTTQTPSNRETTIGLLSQLYCHQNQLEKAEQILKQGLHLFPESPLLTYHYAELLWNDPTRRQQAHLTMNTAHRYALTQMNNELLAQIYLTKLNHYVSTPNEALDVFKALESLDESKLPFSLQKRIALNRYYAQCTLGTNKDRKKILRALINVFYLNDPDKASTHLAQGLFYSKLLTQPSKEAEAAFSRVLEVLPCNIIPTTTARYMTLIGLYYARVKNDQKKANNYFADAERYLFLANTMTSQPIPEPSVFSSTLSSHAVSQDAIHPLNQPSAENQSVSPHPQAASSVNPPLLLNTPSINVNVVMPQNTQFIQETSEQLIKLKVLIQEAQAFLTRAESIASVLTAQLGQPPRQ